MIGRPPVSTGPETLLPYTTLCRCVPAGPGDVPRRYDLDPQPARRPAAGERRLGQRDELLSDRVRPCRPPLDALQRQLLWLNRLRAGTVGPGLTRPPVA